MALSPRLLIRMSPEVQVLPGPQNATHQRKRMPMVFEPSWLGCIAGQRPGRRGPALLWTHTACLTSTFAGCPRLSRTPVFGRIAVVERITSRADVDAASLCGERPDPRDAWVGCAQLDVTETAAVRPTASATTEQEQKVTRGHRSYRPRRWAITAASPRPAPQLCEVWETITGASWASGPRSAWTSTAACAAILVLPDDGWCQPLVSSRVPFGLCGPVPSSPGDSLVSIASPTRSRKSLTVASATRCSSTRSTVRPTAPRGGR